MVHGFTYPMLKRGYHRALPPFPPAWLSQAGGSVFGGYAPPEWFVRVESEEANLIEEEEEWEFCAQS